MPFASRKYSFLEKKGIHDQNDEAPLSQIKRIGIGYQGPNF
jgi:hypothetical protein